MDFLVRIISFIRIHSKYKACVFGEFPQVGIQARPLPSLVVCVFFDISLKASDCDLQEPDRNELTVLKSLLFEFFTQPITNERRREIECSFSSWQEQENSWKQSIEFLSSSNDQYVTMFCLAALEVSSILVFSALFGN